MQVVAKAGLTVHEYIYVYISVFCILILRSCTYMYFMHKHKMYVIYKCSMKLKVKNY